MLTDIEIAQQADIRPVREIAENVGKDRLTPNLEHEFTKYGEKLLAML